MTCLVTPDEARTIQAFFRNKRIIRDLTDLAEVQRLTLQEGRALRASLAEVDVLREQVKLINQRSFANNNQGDQVAA